MGRQVRRVPLDFKWELNQPWEGFVNPYYEYRDCCPDCKNGWSAYGTYLTDLWYGYVEFKPEDNGSTPFLPDHEQIVKHAIRNVERSGYYAEKGPQVIKREAERLCKLFNSKWSNHLNDADVKALIDSGRLSDFSCRPIPTAQEVNDWAILGMGHDTLNCHVCVKARAIRDGESYTCKTCNGSGDYWEKPEYEQLYENWEEVEPPVGEGYQVWETVSEGSPISPVFATPEELAKYMVAHPWGSDGDTTYKQWLKFIRGPGWAPSAILGENGVQSGVSYIGAT